MAPLILTIDKKVYAQLVSQEISVVSQWSPQPFSNRLYVRSAVNVIQSESSMYISYFILLSTIQKTYTNQEDWINSLIKHINADKVTHQVVVFINKSEMQNVLDQDDIVQKLIQQVPVLFIDLSEDKCGSINRSLSLPFFINPRQASIYIILVNNIESELRSIIDLSAHSLITTRPKTLFVVYQNSRIVYEDIQIILLYAWSKKFLDFSVIEVNVSKSSVNYKPFIYNFNPFYNKTYKSYVYSNAIIFPDKLKNLNHYPLKIPIFHSPPYIVVNESESGQLISVKGVAFPMVIIAAKSMNFKIEYAVTLKKDTPILNWKNIVLKKLNEDIIDVVSIPLLDSIGREFLQIYDGRDCADYIALVPIIKFEKMNLTLYNLIYLLTIIIIFICFTYKFNRYRTNAERWNLNDVVQLIFGQSIRKIPEKVFNKIIFITITITYMVFCNMILSSLINAKVIEYEVPFNTFEQISESNLKICVENVFFDLIFNQSNNPHIQEMIKRTIPVANINECVDMLLYDKSCICILNKFKAKTIIKENIRSDGTTVMKIAKPIFLCEDTALVIQKGSPYFEKFETIIKWIIQSGIHHGWESVRIFEMIPNYEAGEEDTKNVFLVQGYLVLSTGYLIAIVIFFIEKFSIGKGLRKIWNDHHREQNVRHNKKVCNLQDSFNFYSTNNLTR